MAFPFAVVDPDPPGGAEQVISALDARLVAEGERSFALAAAGSRVAGHTVVIPAPPRAIDRATWWAAHDACRTAIAGLLREHAVDVLHLHGHDFLSYLPDVDLPVIATLHMPRAWYPTPRSSPRGFIGCACRTASAPRSRPTCRSMV